LVLMPMPNRARDWLTQAQRDVELARHASQGGYHEWGCFAAQQAAEKAVKALVAALNGEARGHAIVAMAAALPAHAALPAGLLDAARRLDRHYIPTRYPNGFDRGAPKDYFTAADSGQAIADAEAILGFCARHVS
ncbi:MAG: HEPN domain-containing protein, partial [Candidatus Rokuibacteriota bacterium]